ncbi:hypothetical protein ACJJH9_15740 [Microbulbifer sp. DLAB2-AF]|uniref:hypothetical protein n=1 Tax=Microbulbifer sp. DLAB2-AF TaxID=3243395 RepID=UPI0040397026
MDRNFETFQKMYEEEISLPQPDLDYLVDAAFSLITNENVQDFIDLLKVDKTGAKGLFWKEVDESPATEKGWDRHIYIVGEINHEKYKRKRREKVELIRTLTSSS